ncbi:hypothetical protein LP419_40425 [Massilia sp. H-1]|nr:hypothetical protein LP419_40425 [Massilia sp. H-1]
MGIAVAQRRHRPLQQARHALCRRGHGPARKQGARPGPFQGARHHDRFHALELSGPDQAEARDGVRKRQFPCPAQAGLAQALDGAYINVEVAKYQLREMLHQPDSLVFDPDLPHTKDFYYFSSVKHPKVIQEFNTFLATEVVQYEQIRKKLGIESSIHADK